MAQSPALAAPGRRIGVLVNARIGRNRDRTAGLRALLAERPDVARVETAAAEDTLPALRRLAADGVDVLAVAGGDGTLQGVFGAILDAAAFPAPPLLAVLPGGTTNMIAHDLGIGRGAAPELRRLLDLAASGGLDAAAASRTLIRLRHGEAAASSAYGLFFGAAGIVQGTLISRGSVDRAGLRNAAGPVAGLLSLLGPLLLGRNPIHAVPAALRLDGEMLAPAEYLALVASTMDKLSLGLVPFWGKGPGAIRFTAVRRDPRRLWRALWPALRGRDHPLLRPENGYLSRNADRIEVAMAARAVLDGEFYEAGPGAPLVLERGPALRFVGG